MRYLDCTTPRAGAVDIEYNEKTGETSISFDNSLIPAVDRENAIRWLKAEGYMEKVKGSLELNAFEEALIGDLIKSL